MIKFSDLYNEESQLNKDSFSISIKDTMCSSPIDLEKESINIPKPRINVTKEDKPNFTINIDKPKVSNVVEDKLLTMNKIDSVNIEEPEEDHLCLKNQCASSNCLGCQDETGYFKIENLFSELTSDYQRTLARVNLGIAEEYSLVWGNIQGNLANQKDLVRFVSRTVEDNINILIEDLNLRLEKWIKEINTSLELKANVFSPSFTGEPTVPTPLTTDDSNRIASTEWVNARIKEASISGNIEVLDITPKYRCYGDSATNVVVSWRYSKPISSQSINGIELDTSIRNYLFKNVRESLIITLQCSYENKEESRSIVFESLYPIYYGTADNYLDINKTINDRFTIDLGTENYLYMFIPDGAVKEVEINGIVGGFELLRKENIYNNIYYVYKSTNFGLGLINAHVINLKDIRYNDK